MKTIKFEEKLVAPILSGQKTITWRMFDDKDLRAGDEVEFVNRATGEIFAYVLLDWTREKPLGEVTQDDYDGHERYESNDELLATFRSYYGERVTLETLVKVIGFHQIKYADSNFNVEPGLYEHYKGKHYRVIGTARHSETLEEMVVYQAQYVSEEFGAHPIWVRPKSMFLENVMVDGKEVPRFKHIG